MSLDLFNEGYEWMQFSGAWSRERVPVVKKIENGITAIESKRGGSSAFQNPFVIIKKHQTDDFAGKAYGFSFVYSGNFLAQAEADNYNRVRFLMGIHPERFCWPLRPDDSFITPEVVMCYSDYGLNALSQTYHRLYNNHLVRGKWKNKKVAKYLKFCYDLAET